MSNFLALYPSSPYSQRVAAMLAVHREETIWRRCIFNNTTPAYWSYLRRCPRGPHAWDARRRLAMIGAPLEGPLDLAFIDFGVPPRPPNELVFVDRPILMFEGTGWLCAAIAARAFLSACPGTAVVPAFVRPPRTVAVRPSPPGSAPGRTPVALHCAVAWLAGTTAPYGCREADTSAAATASATSSGVRAGRQASTSAVAPAAVGNPLPARQVACRGEGRSTCK